KGSIEERAAAVVSTFVTRKVVIFAIIEAIAVYGLVLAIVGRYLLDQYLLSALSLVLLVLEYPTERFLVGLVQDVEGSAAQVGVKCRQTANQRTVGAPPPSPGRITQGQLQSFEKYSPRQLFGAKAEHMFGRHLRVDEVKFPTL